MTLIAHDQDPAAPAARASSSGRGMPSGPGQTSSWQGRAGGQGPRAARAGRRGSGDGWPMRSWPGHDTGRRGRIDGGGERWRRRAAAAGATGFTGFTPEALQFLADLAVNNDRAWFTPRKAEFERLLKEPMEALCVALADAFPRHGVPADRRPEAIAVPDLPRHALLQGQVPVQAGALGGVRVGRVRPEQRAAARRARPAVEAATSTSSPARCTSAAACGTRNRPGSPRSAAGS